MSILLKIYIEIIIVKLKKFFNIKLNTECIPEGCYCYDVISVQPSPPRMKIKLCPYYRNYKNKKEACIYEGFFGIDPLLTDQCKICGIKDD